MEIAPASFTIDGMVYQYDDAEGQLYVPQNSHSGLYMPKVTHAEKRDGKILLTVGYICAILSVSTDPAGQNYALYPAGRTGEHGP